MKVYNKLVRDKIPEIIKKDGKVPIVKIADDEEFELKLIEKLKEEIEEYEKDKNPEELADILEIIDSVIKLNKINKKDLIKIRNKKSKEKGSFDNKVILKEVK